MRRPRLGPQLAFALCVAAMAVCAPASLGAVQVAYRCDVDICLLDPDAPSTVTNLTDNGTTSLDETPVWSPDGKRIAFVSTFGGGARNIFVMTPDAPGQAINLATQVTHYPNTGSYVENPVWSRDGTRIAFEQEPNINGPFGIYVAAADGTTAQPLTITTNGAFPTWSPDGTKIAFSKGEQVYIANSDGSTTTPAPLENGAGHDPIWSPDGTRIAFVSFEVGQGNLDIWVMNADGTAPMRLTQEAGPDLAPHWQPIPA
jgi:TolB protein